MNKHNPFELHDSRLSTTDEHGHRVTLYPENLPGKWKSRRRIFSWFLFFIFLAVPWITINGRPLLLIDLPGREFIIFGHSFWGHDTPMFFLVLASFAAFMAGLTSVGGRLWCGWACPQTVFIETFYRAIEEFVEGKANKRKKFNEGKKDGTYFFKKSVKWLLFLGFSLILSHTFLSYFVSSHRLIDLVTHSPFENWVPFVSMLVLTGIFLFDFGYFREQFCIIACPYGRIQSVLMDEHSLVVAYDEKRGEPRKQPGQHQEETEVGVPQGDCINCYFCVRACPTGIDIRRGTQLECIACTQCIDACDYVMEKIHKPTGLIRYTTEDALENPNATSKKKRFRPYIYFSVFLLLISVATYLTSQHGKLTAMMFRASNTPYRQIVHKNNEKEIINHYKLELYYGGKDTKSILVSIDDINKDKIKLVTPKNPIQLTAKRKEVVHLFFKFHPDLLRAGRKDIVVKVKDETTGEIIERDVILVGPL